MPKNLIRSVSLLMAISLAADPVSAGGLSQLFYPSHATPAAVTSIARCFQEEALISSSLFQRFAVLRTPLKIYSSLTHQIRQISSILRGDPLFAPIRRKYFGSMALNLVGRLAVGTALFMIPLAGKSLFDQVNDIENMPWGGLISLAILGLMAYFAREALHRHLQGIGLDYINETQSDIGTFLYFEAKPKRNSYLLYLKYPTYLHTLYIQLIPRFVEHLAYLVASIIVLSYYSPIFIIVTLIPMPFILWAYIALGKEHLELMEEKNYAKNGMNQSKTDLEPETLETLRKRGEEGAAHDFVQGFRKFLYRVRHKILKNDYWRENILKRSQEGLPFAAAVSLVATLSHLSISTGLILGIAAAHFEYGFLNMIGLGMEVAKASKNTAPFFRELHDAGYRPGNRRRSDLAMAVPILLAGGAALWHIISQASLPSYSFSAPAPFAMILPGALLIPSAIGVKVSGLLAMGVMGIVGMLLAGNGETRQIDLEVDTDEEMARDLENVRAYLQRDPNDSWKAPGKSPFGHTSKVDPKIVLPQIVKGLEERNIHYPASEILVIGPPLDDSEIVAALQTFPAVQTIHSITPAPEEEITSRLIAPIEQRLHRQPQIVTHFRFIRGTVLGLRRHFKPHTIGVVIINNVLDERTNYFSRGMVRRAYEDIAEVLDPQGIVITGGALHTRPTPAVWPRAEPPFVQIFSLDDTASLDYKFVYRLAESRMDVAPEEVGVSRTENSKRESLILDEKELQELLSPLALSDAASVNPMMNEEKELHIEVADARKGVLDLWLERNSVAPSNVKLRMTLLSEEAAKPTAAEEIVKTDIERKTSWFNAAMSPLLKNRQFLTIESGPVTKPASKALLKALGFDETDSGEWIKSLQDKPTTSPSPAAAQPAPQTGLRSTLLLKTWRDEKFIEGLRKILETTNRNDPNTWKPFLKKLKEANDQLESNRGDVPDTLRVPYGLLAQIANRFARHPPSYRDLQYALKDLDQAFKGLMVEVDKRTEGGLQFSWKTKLLHAFELLGIGLAVEASLGTLWWWLDGATVWIPLILPVVMLLVMPHFALRIRNAGRDVWWLGRRLRVEIRDGRAVWVHLKQKREFSDANDVMDHLLANPSSSRQLARRLESLERVAFEELRHLKHQGEFRAQWGADTDAHNWVKKGEPLFGLIQMTMTRSTSEYILAQKEHLNIFPRWVGRAAPYVLIPLLLLPLAHLALSWFGTALLEGTIFAHSVTVHGLSILDFAGAALIGATLWLAATVVRGLHTTRPYDEPDRETRDSA